MATRKTSRQKQAEEAVQKRPVQEIEMELGATPLAPPVEVSGIEYPVRASEQELPCLVVDDPEPRTQIALMVLERRLSPDELPLYERLEALMDTLLPGDNPVPDYPPPLDGRRCHHVLTAGSLRTHRPAECRHQSPTSQQQSAHARGIHVRQVDAPYPTSHYVKFSSGMTLSVFSSI